MLNCKETEIQKKNMQSNLCMRTLKKWIYDSVPWTYIIEDLNVVKGTLCQQKLRILERNNNDLRS